MNECMGMRLQSMGMSPIAKLTSLLYQIDRQPLTRILKDGLCPHLGWWRDFYLGLSNVGDVV